MLGADAGLHRADRLAVSVAETMPAALRSAHIFGRSSFFTPRRSMRWPPVTLTVGTLVLLRRIGDGAQFIRRGQATPHPRHHRVGAVLLDVGVRALVDEARLRIVLRLVRKAGDQVVVDRRTTLVAAVRRLPVHGLEYSFPGWSDAWRRSPRGRPCEWSYSRRAVSCRSPWPGRRRPASTSGICFAEAGTGAAGGRGLVCFFTSSSVKRPFSQIA